MADDKDGRENQAQNEKRRQRERAVTAELERWDETEPPVDPSALDEFESDLDVLAFPATGAEVVEAVGDREVTAVDGSYAVADLVPAVETETFDEPAAVRERVQRPTVAAAMKRIVETSEEARNVEFGRSQRKAYERTFRELRAIDADDDDEGIEHVADWIVGRIHEKGKLPGSRGVRREAAKFCRANDYQVRNDEWLGI